MSVVADKLPAEDAGGFAVLTFTLYLKRRMIFSSYILTFPVVFMSFLTLLVFWLPAESADKSNLGMYILVILITGTGQSCSSSCVSKCPSVHTHISVRAGGNFLILAVMMDYDQGLIAIVWL